MRARLTSPGLALLLVVGSLLPTCRAPRETGRDAQAGCECGPRASCVSLRLQAPKRVYQAGEKVVLHGELTNVSHGSVVARKYLGIGDLSSSRQVYPAWMEIYRDGEVVGWVADLPFGGVRPDRDFRALAPGESVVQDYDVARSYDLSRAGEYRISLHYQDLFEDAALLKGACRPVGELESPPVHLRVVGTAPRTKIEPWGPPLRGR
jgi:hypothetical protein